MIRERYEKQIRENIKIAIKAYKKKNKVSQNEIARQNEINPGNLSKFLKGKPTISDKKLTKLMQYLKIY